MGVEPVRWRLRTRTLDTEDHTLLMGIVNVTPDSFADAYPDPEEAIGHGFEMAAAGADLVDVGGESTRPGSIPVDEATEVERVLPVVTALASEGIVVSVDTTKPGVAAATIDAGAEVVNDISALADPAMADVCADAGVGLVLMHRGVDPVADYLGAAADRAIAAGISRDRIAIDPGFGFDKTPASNLVLLAGLDELAAMGFPVVVGTSRKGTLGRILDAVGHPAEPADRDPATAATVALAIAHGASVVRVHNVASALQAARTADAIVRS